jgi:hypothetical protein
MGDPALTKVPTGAVGGDDILAPAQALLRGLSILPASSDLNGNALSVAVTGTPDSVSIIEAGGTALSKGFASLIALLGGATAVTTAVTGFWKNETTTVRVTLLGGSAFFLAAAAIAIAVIVASDVTGRAAGAVAQYEARRHIGTTLLQLSLTAHQAGAGTSPSPGPPAVPGNSPTGAVTPMAATLVALVAAGALAPVTVKSSGQTGSLSGIRAGDSGPQVQITNSGGVKLWLDPDELVLQDYTWKGPGSS